MKISLRLLTAALLATWLSTAALADEKLAAVAPAVLQGADPNYLRSTESSFSEEGWISRLLSKTDVSWTAKLNGQALGQPLGTNYSPFARGNWPIYLYHTLDTVHYLGATSSAGVEVSATQDLVHGVKDDWGYPIEPSFTVYDPQIWYRQNGIIETDWLAIDGQLNLFPAVTSYSREFQTALFSTALDTTYALKLKDRRWMFHLNTRIRPTFYSQTQPPMAYPHFGEQRERLFLSMGHFVSYRLSDRFELSNSSLLDCNYYADSSGTFIRGDANDDRTQVQLNYYHPSGRLRVGAYLQGILSRPRIETSTVGVDLTVHFFKAN